LLPLKPAYLLKERPFAQVELSNKSNGMIVEEYFKACCDVIDEIS
jgi:hypothetical protein